jgi:hypothetical protein
MAKRSSTKQAKSKKTAVASAPIAETARGPAIETAPNLAAMPASQPVEVPTPQPVAPSMEPKAEPREAFALRHEAIAARAYERYLARAGRAGSAEADWLAAEAELRAAVAA